MIDLTALTSPDTGFEEPDVDTDGILDDEEITSLSGATKANPIRGDFIRFTGVPNIGNQMDKRFICRPVASC